MTFERRGLLCFGFMEGFWKESEFELPLDGLSQRFQVQFQGLAGSPSRRARNGQRGGDGRVPWGPRSWEAASGSPQRRMGCGRSKLICCKPPKKRHQEQEQPRSSVPQEPGPLNEDTATTVHLCECEETEQQQKDITRILQQHEEEKKQWQQQVEKERELELREKLAEQRLVLEGEHEEALRVLRASHEQEKEALIHSSQEAKAALQETIDELTSQLQAFQAKMKRVEESILSRNYKKHIQDYGSPSPFWEQELESLHFVIEMKNERIRELDKRLIHMETVKEKNLMLEEKITTLQQENEDLHVRGRNQVVMSRQLSEDLLLAREALEKELQLRRQLQQEKEELLYRVLGADASPAFPLASVTPTEVSFLAT
ncbi:coiled-coil domain-containing protein 69 [Elephas maximus indicus]|uniref:coiled-coil domain-containing protein 69 n=1 Tax=Elephas maximus indicus TaxID=99487 RepID=UPI002116D53E|nr:coiled-coil domain-containing protein 69 [Elephas maximus indicus]